MEAGYLDPKLLNYKDPAHSSALLKNHLVAQFLFQGSTAVVSRDDALELCHVQPKLRTESLQLRDKFGSILAPGLCALARMSSVYYPLAFRARRIRET